MLRNILRAEPVSYSIMTEEVVGNSLLKIELSLVDYYMKKSNEKHYARKVRRFYKKYGIEISGYLPETEYADDGSSILKSCTSSNKPQTSTVRNFNFADLYDLCLLYRDFSDDKDLSMDEFYHIVSNLRTVGKR